MCIVQYYSTYCTVHIIISLGAHHHTRFFVLPSFRRRKRKSIDVARGDSRYVAGKK
jgi:hypothetical protein